MELTTEKKNQIKKLTKFIEENLRTSSKTKSNFIDPSDFSDKILYLQNHVIFGRRGAGKSSLVNTLLKNVDVNSILVNLEDFKDISFPNIIIKVLIAIFKKSILLKRKSLNLHFIRPSYYTFKKRINQKIKIFEHQLSESDLAEQTQTSISKSEANVGVATESIEFSAKEAFENEITEILKKDKLDLLKKSITDLKETLDFIYKKLEEKPIFLIFDDFYFLPRSIQPLFIDFFHRLSKDSDLFLKVATIKHRTSLYITHREAIYGVEINHDIIPIDLDYTLDQYGNLRSFMEMLLKGFIASSQSNIQINEVFIGESFSQLCIASGGVPRDFLTLVNGTLNALITNKIKQIDKVTVTEEAISTISNKLTSLKKDTSKEVEILENYLYKIKEFIIKKNRSNVFLIAKEDLEQNPLEKQAIKELMDMRLLHIIDANTSSAPSDGRRYEAYMIDIGMYDNSKPREFNPYDFDEQVKSGKKEKLRASPRLSLKEIRYEEG